MRVRFTRRAEGDLDSILAYLDERSPSAARSVSAAIGRSISRLADFPLIAPKTSLPGVRELSLLRYPYKIYYEVEEDDVSILHIRHARRRPWPDEDVS